VRAQVVASGGRVHAGVCMQAGRQGLGLAAGVPVRAGEVLVRLPADLQLAQHSDNAPRQLTGKLEPRCASVCKRLSARAAGPGR